METFVRSGLTFDVRDGGPRDGEIIVLLHGFPQDGSSWDGVVPILHDAGYRTLVPDQRGYSPGARPRGRKHYTLSETSQDVLALLDAAGATAAHVVGHDWGGAVAWILGGRHAARVRSLTVFATPHPAAMIRSARESDQARRSWYIFFFQLPLLPELAFRLRGEQLLAQVGMPAEAAARYLTRLRQPGALTATINWYRAMVTGRRDSAPRSRVPTTYAWGNKDFALGRHAAEKTANFVLSEYQFVELDAGHWMPERRPAEVAEIVLSRVQRSAR